MISKMLEYLSDNSAEIMHQIAVHLEVSLIALLVAVVIGVPLGYIASKSEKSEKIVSLPFNILRVVPSLALLILLIPIIGTGIKPAVIALAILAIPPVLLNTIVGFRQVPDFMVESARGIGLTEKQVLKHIRIPMALPMIFAGVRTGLIEAVASATLAAKIGAGGLGEIIFTGLGLNRTDLLLIGGIAVAILSLCCGLIFDLITRRVLRYKFV